jgi:predicted dehydrogenase
VFEAGYRELPKIGRILAASCVKTQGYPRKPVDWVATVGVLPELSIHDLDLLDWYLRSAEVGEATPIVLSAELVHRFDLPAEDQAYLTIRYPGGIIAQVAGIFTKETKFLNRDVALTIVGDRGFIRVERPNRIVVHADTYEEFEVPADDVSPFDREALNLIGAILQREPLRVRPYSGVHANSIIQQARQKGTRS